MGVNNQTTLSSAQPPAALVEKRLCDIGDNGVWVSDNPERYGHARRWLRSVYYASDPDWKAAFRIIGQLLTDSIVEAPSLFTV